jgi:cyclopropane fatty-acyl-phospholipid synthase-like methyltransferase
VEVHECHWRDFEDADRFDAVFTDEVIVHFGDLQGFFEQVRKLLKPDGLMLNKELHFVTSHVKQLTRSMIFLNKIYGETGHYRTLHEELALLDQTGFMLERIEQIPLANYQKTADGWLANMQRHRSRLEEVVGAEHYQRFRTYLRIVRKMHGSARPPMTLDVVAARSPA